MILYSTIYCSGSQDTQVICTLCIESVSPLNNIDQYMPACLCQQKRGLLLQTFILSLSCSNLTRPCSTLNSCPLILYRSKPYITDRATARGVTASRNVPKIECNAMMAELWSPLLPLLLGYFSSLQNILPGLLIEYRYLHTGTI